MSRIGKLPIIIPEGVTVEIKKNNVKVSKGNLFLEQTVSPVIKLNHDKSSGTIQIIRESDNKASRSLHGLYRSLINNMVIGVTKGFARKLEIVGIGYRAELKDNWLHLQLGYSHPIVFIPPEGVELVVENPTSILVKGYDKQLVGQVAAKIRSFRPPEPYKGKGIRYENEVVRRKAGKAAG